MSRIPEFIATLDKMRSLHEAKNEDYAQSSDPFSNFSFTEYVLKTFTNDRDKTFVWPIATKLARLSTLLTNLEKAPNNESIEDSFLDIAVYVLLWKVDVERRLKGLQGTTERYIEPLIRNRERD